MNILEMTVQICVAGQAAEHGELPDMDHRIPSSAAPEMSTVKRSHRNKSMHKFQVVDIHVSQTPPECLITTRLRYTSDLHFVNNFDMMQAGRVAS